MRHLESSFSYHFMWKLADSEPRGKRMEMEGSEGFFWHFCVRLDEVFLNKNQSFANFYTRLFTLFDFFFCSAFHRLIWPFLHTLFKRKWTGNHME